MILAARTDKPESELYLYDGNKLIDTYKWQAHRELANTIHLKIKDILIKNKISYDNLSGLVIYKGPGSFTGLRIGIGVFNAISYIQNIPIIGMNGEGWLQDGLSELKLAKNHKVVLPYYGAEANVSKPKK